MQEIDVDGWQAFEARLANLRECRNSSGRPLSFLFRGQADSTWRLVTTLERRCPEQMLVSQYYRLILAARPQIESFTGREWKLREYPEVARLLRSYDTLVLHQFPTEAEYSYLVHLRHHMFPSPLLDWTRSPYVAAYFAFHSGKKPAEETVSIFAYSDSPEGMKVDSTGEPQIRRIGPYVRTHRRHFLQQSDYTMCVLFEDNDLRFVPHENVFVLGDTKQDALWKFNIPWTERLSVLRSLDEYNLNAFSLFESEESLMETIALRTFDFREANL